MDSCLTYRAYRGADGALKVRKYDVSELVDTLTIEEFHREYNNTRNTFYKN